MGRRYKSFEHMMARTGCADTRQNRSMWSLEYSDEDLSRGYTTISRESDDDDSEAYMHSMEYQIQQIKEREKQK